MTGETDQDFIQAEESLENPQDPERIILPTAYDILTAVLPEIVWVVPGYIPAGFTILAGRPKVGKSWLALQVSRAVDSGGKIFDQDIERGAVLYLALEDSRRRLQSRMQKQGWDTNQDTQANFLTYEDFRRYIGFFNKGGSARLYNLIKVNKYRLVIIDTLSRAFAGVKDMNDSQEVTTALSPLQEMANELNMAILVLDHHNKPKGFTQDPVDDVMSSTAKSAIADTVLGIYTEQGKRGAILKGRGRDIEEIDKRMTFDAITGAWQIEGDTYEVKITEQQNEILEALKILGRSKASAIAAHIGADRGNVTKQLNNMCTKGLITPIAIGATSYYSLKE